MLSCVPVYPPPRIHFGGAYSVFMNLVWGEARGWMILNWTGAVILTI
jgi:hypothetical protein